MPVIEAYSFVLKYSKHFASIELVAGYSKCPLDLGSKEACGIVAPQDTFVSTRVLHGLKNASSYAQSTIAPILDRQ